MLKNKLVTLAAGICLLVFGQSCTQLDSTKSVQTKVSATDSSIRYSGRQEVDQQGRVVVGYSGARARMRFEGSSIAVRITDDSGENYAQAWVDGERLPKFRLNDPSGYYQIADGLSAGAHTVEVMRITECFLGLTRFDGFVFPEGGNALAWKDEDTRKIEFIGDSITCGYGVEAEDANMPFEASTENFSLDYSGLTVRALGADFLVVARSGIGMVRNYDGPFEGNEDAMPFVYPNTFYLNNEYVWDFQKFTPDLVCINLGTNDFSTSGVNVDTYVDRYTEFATNALERYPEAELVLIQGPMNNGPELRAALDRVLSNLQEVDADRVNFVELSAQGAVGFGASYHPNQAQSRINADELTSYLSDLMGWK